MSGGMEIGMYNIFEGDLEGSVMFHSIVSHGVLSWLLSN